MGEFDFRHPDAPPDLDDLFPAEKRPWWEAVLTVWWGLVALVPVAVVFGLLWMTTWIKAG